MLEGERRNTEPEGLGVAIEAILEGTQTFNDWNDAQPCIGRCKTRQHTQRVFDKDPRALLDRSELLEHLLLIADQRAGFLVPAHQDGRFVAESRNVTLEVHPPRKTGEWTIKPEHPWERGGVGPYSNVLYDGQTYHFWYHVMDTVQWHTGQTNGCICYARSSDGIHWEKPVLGLTAYAGSRSNNIVVGHGAAGLTLPYFTLNYLLERNLIDVAQGGLRRGGTPLPLTDVIVNPADGAMYFTIGGRRTQSAHHRQSHARPLYRFT